MVPDDVGFDVAITRARLEQWLTDNGLVPMTEPPTTPSMVAWQHLSLHGVPTKELVDGEWVDSPRCRVSPCKAAGVAFAIFEIDQYLKEAGLERSELVDALDRVASGLNRFESAAQEEWAIIEAHSLVEKARFESLAAVILPEFLNRANYTSWGEEPLHVVAELRRVHQEFRDLAQRSRANLVSPAFHVAKGRGRRQVPFLDAVTQHLCENGFSYAEVVELVADGITGDADAARERVRKRAANPERRSLFPAQQDPEPAGIK
jgi:hypothetical protein